MSTFREIDEKLLQLVDEEGEILDAEAFEALQMERTEKAQNMALWVLDLQDEQEAIKREIDRLTARKKAAERKENSLKSYLQMILGGEKLKTDLVAVSYRKTAAVEVTDEKALRTWAMVEPMGENVLKYREPEISKTAIKELMSKGVEVPGAAMTDRIATVIK
jgi:hypothetical protein